MGNKRFQRVGVGVVGLALAATAMTGTGAIAGAAPVPGTGSSSGSSEGDVLDLLNTGSAILKGEGPSGPPAVQRCNESTKSGNDGVTETIHQLGKAGPTAFVLAYDTQTVPDRIEVFYQGGRVADTGFVGDANASGQGTGSVTVRLPRGVATSVLVRVTGGTDTVWGYTVSCPA
ncbi:hypothetical protein [Williamsia maris]|uniref:Secreted protein n=1 Tax=Williamsia maris TaxID=72806 RepID=A0ABT1HER0_9NOCA|nr:hypothetical protein [Williamsia maris]MCP2176201.1 hypothetical protein [Williamsia maris]